MTSFILFTQKHKQLSCVKLGPYWTSFLSQPLNTSDLSPSPHFCLFPSLPRLSYSESYPSPRVKFNPLSLHKATLTLLGSHNLFPLLNLPWIHTMYCWNFTASTLCHLSYPLKAVSPQLEECSGLST